MRPTGRWLTRFATSNRHVYNSKGVKICSPTAFFRAILQFFTDASVHPFWCGDARCQCGESPLHSLFCWELAQSSVVAYNDAGLSSYREESSEYLDELHGWAVYSKFQVNCSGIQAGEYQSITLGCLVTTNFNMVGAKEIAGRVIKRRRTRGQTAIRQFSHDLIFGLGLHFTAKHASKLHSLGTIMGFKDPEPSSCLYFCCCNCCVSTLVYMTCYEKRYPVFSGK